METSEIILKREAEALGPWFHNLHLPGEIQTAPNHFLGDFPLFKWKEIEKNIEKDLSGKTVLDIGCNAGFYSFELAKRGAHVTGIDVDPHYLKQAKWAAKQFNLEDQTEFLHMQVYDLVSVRKKFDIVWFMGVLYHLRYPMLALDIISQKVNDKLVMQTLSMPDEKIITIEDDYKINDRNHMLQDGYPKMAFIENKLAGDPTNWWAPNKACVAAMLRTCGLKIISEPSHETYICQKDPGLTAVAKSWNKSEFLSATGKDWQQVLNTKVAGKNKVPTNDLPG